MKKQILTWICYTLFTVVPIDAIFAQGTVNLSPVADSYVHSSRPTTNYGNDNYMVTKSSSDERYAYLKFDLSSIQNSIISATLRLNTKSVSFSSTRTVYAVGDDSWTESNITWNNKPAYGNPVTSQSITSVGQYFEWDVTMYINAEYSGDGVASLVVADAGNTSTGIDFYSKENGSDEPILVVQTSAGSSTFVHPGLLHTKTDLDRMKERVAQQAHPWIDGWNEMIQDPKAQNSYLGRARENMNVRQVMSDDAIAAYLNALRWYISGDNSHAQCAIGILNNYSNTVNQIPSGGNTDIDGLGGIGVAMMCNAAEIMKLYSGWNSGDIDNFKDMMVDYFYPLRHEFLTYHRGSCIDNYWANWDANNITALLAIGVVADNQAIYDEGYDYYLNGAGTGNINHAVYYVHPGGLGQWQESGRDQEHAQLGIGLLAGACQIAWNQGQDLFGYDNNRLLAGAEYTAKYNQMQEVPFEPYNNCQPANNDWPAINGRGRLDDRPIWELIYNHYVVRRGLNAPNTQRMAELMRPEHGSKDHLGYGTLTFTLEPSTYPPHPVPAAPIGLTATAGTGQVTLTWQPPADISATGYVVQRSTSSGGSYSTIETYNEYINTKYVDNDVSNGTTYYYRVAAINQSGTGAYSEVSSTRPLATGALPSGWSKAEIGSHNAGSATYANVSGGTFVVDGYGTGIGSAADNVTYVYKQVTGESTITGRINSISGTLLKTGFMVRESLNANAKTVAMTLGEGGWRFARMGYRTSTEVNMSSILGNTYTWQPAWFRISRSGNTFTAYESSDGSTWFVVGTVNIEMASSYFIGLVACSGNATQANITVYDNLTVTGSDEACSPTPIIPVLRVDDGSWQTTTTVTVDLGQQIQFGPQPVSGGSWSWTGCGTSGSTREQTVTPTNTCAATATYTNSCGTQSSVTYNVTVNGAELGGSIYQLRNRSTGLYLDGMGENTNGATCGQWANTSSTNAQWDIQEYNGNYSIRNVATDLYLDGMGRTSNGDDVGHWDNASSTNAQWSIQQYDGIYYRIQNVSTDLFLDGMGRTTNGDACGQWANTTSDNAQWELITVSAAKAGYAEKIDDNTTNTISQSISNLQFYPNPVSSVLSIALYNEFEFGDIKVFDLYGKILIDAEISKNREEVNVDILEQGIYILQITDKAGWSWSGKFIKK